MQKTQISTDKTSQKKKNDVRDVLIDGFALFVITTSLVYIFNFYHQIFTTQKIFISNEW